jgi:hypothetical protein
VWKAKQMKKKTKKPFYDPPHFVRKRKAREFYIKQGFAGFGNEVGFIYEKGNEYAWVRKKSEKFILVKEVLPRKKAR